MLLSCQKILSVEQRNSINTNSSSKELCKELLANANGKERFVTVGCSHITRFCKVAMVGGITSRSKLQIEGTSQLDVPKLKRNANFRIMIEQGWQWYIFPSELDDKYPAFAKLSQRALNSANNCRQTCSEIELACQMVEFHTAALAN